MKVQRLLSACLIAAVLAGSMAGCSKDETPAKKPEKETEVTAPEFAYKATYTPITKPDGKPLDYVNNSTISGNRLYFVGNYLDGMQQAIDELTGEPLLDENGEPMEYENYVEAVFYMDLDERVTKVMEAFVPTEIPEGKQGHAYIEGVFAGNDGSVWVGETVNLYSFDLPENFDRTTDDRYQYYVDEGITKYLTNYAADGTKLKTVQPQTEENVYFDSFYVTSDDQLLGYDWQNIYFFDQNGVQTKCVPVTGGSRLTSLGNDRFAYVGYTEDSNKQQLMMLDLATGTFEPAADLPLNVYELYPGFGEYQYLYGNHDTVFGMKEGDTEGEKLFSWLDCDVDANGIRNFYVLEDGTIAALEANYDPGSNSSNLITLEKVDASTLPQKEILTLGCFGLDWDLRTTIVNFNRNSDSVRIQIKDYSEMVDGSGEDYMASYDEALQKVTTEILSGNAPDILSLDSLPVEQYAAKGLLMDLWPLIDKDPDFGREDLMEHFFDALSIDGKLYQVSNSFSISTAATYTEIADGRTSWTVDEMLEALSALGEGASVFEQYSTSDMMLQTMVGRDLNSYMDWTTGTCSFDSDTFKAALEFAAQFPQESPEYDYDNYESPYSRMKNGKQLMLDQNLSGYDDLQFAAGLLENRAAFIGYPSNSGNGNVFATYGTLGISSTCKNVDAAWSLVRTLLLEENQYEEYMYQFPTNKHAFDKYTEQKMTPEYSIDPVTGEKVEISTGGIGYDDIMIDLYAIKQADYDAFMSLYESCTTVQSSGNTSVMNIIQEHSGAYFAGQKTVDETAKLIQDAVSLYMMEQS